MTGISYLFKLECRSTMLHEGMHISRLRVHAQSIEEAKFEENKKELKRSRSDEPS